MGRCKECRADCSDTQHAAARAAPREPATRAHAHSSHAQTAAVDAALDLDAEARHALDAEGVPAEAQQTHAVSRRQAAW